MVRAVDEDMIMPRKKYETSTDGSKPVQGWRPEGVTGNSGSSEETQNESPPYPGYAHAGRGTHE